MKLKSLIRTTSIYMPKDLKTELMNNKEFIDSMTRKMGIEEKQVTQLVESFVEVLANTMNSDKVVAVQGFGNFEKKEKSERKIYNPSTKTFKVIPSKQVVNFKMSPVLKEKINKPL